jgi:hypothetical protein
MQKRVHNVPIKKKKGLLYFIDKAGDISAVAMARGKKMIKKQIKVLKIGIKRLPGMLYFVDKKGYAAMSPMARRKKTKKAKKRK